MKRIIFWSCLGTLMLGVPAWSAQKPARKASAPHVASARGGNHMARQAPARARGNVRAAPARSMSRATTTARNRSGNNWAANRRGETLRRSNTVRQQGVTGRRNAAVAAERNRNARNPQMRTTNPRVNQTVANANQRNWSRANVRGAAAANVRTRNAPIVNNWRGGGFRGQNYAAFRDYHRQWHNRSWWQSHYDRIILVSGGWWYWNSGYWYPAWGYDPSYTYYPYDGPVYGYSDLTPDQVIVNVQTRLQSDGYYTGGVDGVLGPQTRRAIAAFQADNGLAITSAVDQPTLATLGLS